MQRFNCKVTGKVLPVLVVLVLLACCGQAHAWDPNIETQVETMLSQMTLVEKVGQMLMVAQTKVDPCAVKTHRVGAILINVGINQSLPCPTKWADRLDPLQQGALDTPLGIPLLMATDAVHGHNNAYGATIFPHNIGLGATGDSELMYRIGQVTALEMAATGCDMTLAPCVAVPRDIRWGRTYEGWGEVPEIHDELVGQLIRGIQTPYNGVDFTPCTAKHYIADGGTAWGTGINGLLDQGDCLLSEADLRAIHLPPYQEALDANCQAIMASYSKYQGVEMHHHQYLLTDVLKSELGFDGIVVSDYGAIYDIDGNDRDAIKSAINAGLDMSMENDNWLTFLTELTDLVDNNEVPMSRIDDAVRRILRVKYRAKVFDQPLTDRTITNNRTFGSTAHRAVAREAVRKACVLLQNRGNVLPLKKNLDILVAGDKADNMKFQCGGWTIDWAGAPDTLLPPGTTILGGIENAVVHPGSVTYSVDGTGGEGKDVAIAVVGEESYAEWGGDTESLDAIWGADRTMVSNVAALTGPKVLVIVAGRPIDINEPNILDNFDAVVMAWFLGTEGDGVADVLFGSYPFTGTMSLTWMKDEAQLPMHPGDANYDPMFPLGAGLTTIEFDSASSVSDSAAETSVLGWSHTIGDGNDRVLVVGVVAEDSNSADLVVDSVTYNGIYTNPVPGSSSAAGGTNLMATELYYMLDGNLPAAGTYTVEVSYTGAVNDITAGAISLFNVRQQAAEVVAAGADPNAAEISTEITTLSDGAWLIDIVGSGEPCELTAGSLQMSRWNSSAQGSAAACSTRIASAPRTLNMKWDESVSTALAHSAAAFAPIERVHPKGDINSDFLLDWQDILGFFGDWRPGALPDPAPDDLISHWRFDEASGTVVSDSAGTNHGVSDGNWTDGMALSAADFAGSDVVTCPNDNTLNLSNDFTISLWVKLNPTQPGALINKGSVSAADTNGSYTLYYDPTADGSLTLTLRKDDNATTKSVTVSSFSADDWTHIVATFKSPKMRLYVNGSHPEVTGGFSVSSLYVNSGDLAIGGFADGTHTISGSIDDVRIYDRALDQSEIQDMPPCPWGETCMDVDQKDGVNWADYAQIFDDWNP